MLGDLLRADAALDEFVMDEDAQLILVALLDDPWALWTSHKLSDDLKASLRGMQRRVERLRFNGIVQRVTFWPERDRPWRYWVSPDGLRPAPWLIRANFEALHELAEPLGLSVRKALGFGPLLDACRCKCGRCCCGLPHI